MSIGMVIGMLLIIGVAAVFLSWQHPLEMRGVMMAPVYSYVANYESHSKEVEEIARFCLPFEGEDAVSCVVKHIGFNPEYNYNDSTRWKIRTAEESLKQGMVCRDFVVFAAAIFERMGFKTDYRFLPGHVYLTVFKEIGNGIVWCELNNGDYHCW